MLTKIVDTSQVTVSDINRNSLRIDLQRRLPRYKHVDKPEGAESFKVVVANSHYFFDSFRFEIAYGTGKDIQSFVPIGDSKVVYSEELPFPK